ncbi:uncharacterized protein [Diabrotica undecimpunctata]|uniref:uncharacterized protein n=1 Tax=Diabrotica undecimpunctata TaxID=50387 RepID=UPI003B635926
MKPTQKLFHQGNQTRSGDLQEKETFQSEDTQIHHQDWHSPFQNSVSLQENSFPSSASGSSSCSSSCSSDSSSTSSSIEFGERDQYGSDDSVKDPNYTISPNNSNTLNQVDENIQPKKIRKVTNQSETVQIGQRKKRNVLLWKKLKQKY